MGRKTEKELNNIRKKYGVDTIWSWSRYNCYKNSPYEFYLKYIKKIEPDKQDSIYLRAGGGAHEIIEDYYNDIINYEDMEVKYDELLFELQLDGYEYNRMDSDRNIDTGNRYEDNMRLFFKEHIPIRYNPIIEKSITIKVGKHIFVGYIDVCFNANGTIVVGDWKSSTIYTGEKAIKERGQLVLYTLGLVQAGVPLEKIIFSWNFMKYKTIKYKQKDGKIKYRNMERRLSHEHLDVIDVTDCWISQKITQQELDEFEKKIEKDLDEIVDRINNYENNQDENIWMGEVVDNKNIFYFENLCGYSEKLHVPLREYYEYANMFLFKE